MAAASTRHDTHSTTNSGGWSTKRIATTALFCAVAAVCTLFLEFPIIPAVPFLKYDPSAVFALIAGFAFGPTTGAIVSILPYLVHLATESGIYGCSMAILSTLSLVLPASLIYRRNTSLKGAIIGMVVGAVCCIVCALIANMIVTPIYMSIMMEMSKTDATEMVASLIKYIIAFNIIKIAINCVLTLLVYKPISKVLES